MLFRRLDNVQVKGKTVAINIFQPMPAMHGLDNKLQSYHSALELMMNHEFEQAQEAFEEYIALWPGDKVAQLCLRRINAYVEKPALFDQDYQGGVRTLTSK